MRFDTSQHMRMGQQMKLAPRMIQSMEILQLALPALEERIEQELENNATLEIVEPGAGREEARREIAEQRRDEAEDRAPMEVDEGGGASDFSRLENFESSYSEALENEYSASGLRRFEELREASRVSSRLAGERDGKMDAMANAPGRSASVAQQLLEQWTLADVDDRTRALGRLLIENIDDDGYIRTPLPLIADRAPAEGDAAGAKPDELERALRAVQLILDPPGLGARDTRECLVLQIDALSEDERLDNEGVVRRLIEEHLDDIVHNRLPRVAQATGLTMDDINGALRSMRRLSVVPGRALVQESPTAIVPDAIIEYDEDADRYLAVQTDSRLPNLRINREYAEMVRERDVPKDTKRFIRSNLTNAAWLIDAIEQRRRTLQRVLNVVVDAQRDFFDQGPQALKPLPMTQVADQLGIHVATVSRAVADKHILTPRGVFPLRRFFTGGTQTDAGEDVSWEAIRAALKDIIDGEDKKAPLSDDAIVTELKKRGIEIARRTVAKYRAQLDIPSAKLRKVF